MLFVKWAACMMQARLGLRELPPRWVRAVVRPKACENDRNAFPQTLPRMMYYAFKLIVYTSTLSEFGHQPIAE